ncbi:exodeoxyribonuclease V subunit gamma [Lampropedia aestuarii]|nr:exodeoxyribonuclease V subunit gamma [Lampropedia aestuarii]
MPSSSIAPGLVALHSNRTEKLAQALAHWTQQHPLGVLEQEVFLVQSNGMAEWLKMVLAQELGISASVQVELPGRFAWRMYRQILGAEQVPYQTPLDKPEMLWQLMRLLPQLQAHGAAGLPTNGNAQLWQPLQHMLHSQGSAPSAHTTYQLALRIADLFDQYQVYRPDWLQDWAGGQDHLAKFSPLHLHQAVQAEAMPIDADRLWQPALWRLLLATQSPEQAQAIRPTLHARALQALQQAGSEPHWAAPLPRRVSLFGMSHVALPIMELLTHMAHFSQVLMAIPNPCQEYWSDALDGRELFARMHKQMHRRAQMGQKKHADTLANTPLHAMHAHANPLLSMWGRQVRDFIRLLEHYEQQAGSHAELGRAELYDAPNPEANLLQQVQEQIRDLTPLSEPITTDIAASDHSIYFQCTHSPVREVEALHDHLLDLMNPASTHHTPLVPREVVVMVPDIHQYAPLIEAIFGQYERQDSRYIPFDIADLDAQSHSSLVQALEWLTQLPEQRASLADLADLLRVPAIAQRIGLGEEDVAQLHDWMQGSGIRWGIDAAHREQLGIHAMGEQNTAWFGLQRMLLGYASDAPWAGTEPYEEVGGLAAAHVGALAYLIDQLQRWQTTLASPASPNEWAERWRALRSAFFTPVDEADIAAIKLTEVALQQWLSATEQADFAQALPLSVARHAWLSQWQAPQNLQRFHAGGVTFCTLLPMRAIPFRVVCLLGMNEGVYPRRATPNEMDLMRTPGVLRAGDRSRAQDDRQLMLEALLSAREQLFISWVGRSVRDNTERPPSLLVAQLRDYLSQRWSPQLVAERTIEHPLQPFNPRYFSAMASTAASAAPALHTWADEWRPRQAQALNAPMAQPYSDHDWTAPQSPAALPTASGAGDAARSWSISQLAQVWRNPVQQWFAARLQTRFNELPLLLDEREPLSLDGLQRWQLFEGMAQTLAPRINADSTPEHMQQWAAQYFERLQRSGQLPLGALARQWQSEWLQDCSFFLHEWLQAVHEWPYTEAQRQALQWPAQQPSVEDWSPALRLHATSQPASGLYLDVHAHTILQKPQGPLKVRSLLRPWLQAVLLAAHDEPQGHATRLVALDAVLEIQPLEPGLAREWLHSIVAIAEQAVRTPLPFDLTTALSWWQMFEGQPPVGETAALASDTETALKALQAARQTYDGGHFAGQVQRNPYIARLWPQFDDLLATQAFEAWASLMLAPLQHWIDTCVAVRYAPQ